MLIPASDLSVQFALNPFLLSLSVVSKYFRPYLNNFVFLGQMGGLDRLDLGAPIHVVYHSLLSARLFHSDKSRSSWERDALTRNSSIQV